MFEHAMCYKLIQYTNCYYREDDQFYSRENNIHVSVLKLPPLNWKN